jgi:hypothetical protein
VFAQIEHFFTHYKDLEAEKWVRVGHWGDAAEAQRGDAGGDRTLSGGEEVRAERLCAPAKAGAQFQRRRWVPAFAGTRNLQKARREHFRRAFLFTITVTPG